MSNFKDRVRELCGELRAAADSNDMRNVHAVHQKLARVADGQDEPDDKPEAIQPAPVETSAKSEPRPADLTIF